MKTMRETNEGIEKTKWWKTVGLEGLPITWMIIAMICITTAMATTNFIT